MQVNLAKKVTEAADRAGLTIIEMKFRAYVAQGYSKRVDEFSEDQIQQLRMAFFGGMIAYQGDVLSMIDPSSDESEEAEAAALEEYQHRIMSEIEAEAERVLKDWLDAQMAAPSTGGVQ